MIGPVIVGYDGSHGARAALLWATSCSRPDREVVAIAANAPSSAKEAWNGDGAATCGEASLHLREEGPTAALTHEARARDAAMIVVGHRHGRRLAELRGSVALSLIDFSPCPVVVVPDTIGVGGCTIVGYDGSRGARDALHWTLGQERDGRRLVVVTAARDRLGTSLPSPLGLGLRDRMAEAVAVLDELVLEDDELLEAEFSVIAVDDHPGKTLHDLAETEDAQEIVVGRGPHAHEIVERAGRPVIVVPT